MKKKAKKRAKVSKKGNDLFAQLIELTGLPARTIKKELALILERKQIDIDSLTLEQLRDVAASYVREIMTLVLDRHHSRRDEPQH